MAVSKKLEGVDLDKLERQIIYWKDHLDIAIEDLCPGVKLSKQQRVIARMCGRCSVVKNIESRGSGKTWLTAYIAHVLAVLNPYTSIAVVSATEVQATLVLKKLRDIAEASHYVKDEMVVRGNTAVVVNQHKGYVRYKNGSSIESYSLSSVRGQRAKIIIVDEAPEIDQKLYDAAASPIRNYTREICISKGFQDFKSKEICLTSCCEQANPFYEKFKDTVNEMIKGSPEHFACALDYRAAIESGLTDAEFFESERKRLPDYVFQMEYGSIFMGSAEGTAFPYGLINQCRTLELIETDQPKTTKSRYVISVDIATSEASNADNTAITVIKFAETSSGEFRKRLVYIRTLHGQSLDVIADTVLDLYYNHFPSAEKIVYDARGLGDSFDRFMDRSYVDAKGVEHPPLICDDKLLATYNGLPMLHPFRAIQQLNQRLYTNMRVNLEKRTVELPLVSRIAEQRSLEKESGNQLSFMQRAIFQEADALAFEMSNIVGRKGSSGNVLYDVAHAQQHKDRYSSFAMGLDYVCELEEDNIKRKNNSTVCIGIASYF